jgi:hypothetical protein
LTAASIHWSRGSTSPRETKREATVANAPAPTDAEVKDFLAGLHSYRETLPEKQQLLLDAMVAAAIGKKAGEEEEEVQSYWVAVNPRGPVGGPGYGVAAVGPYGAAGYTATPWGAAYGVRVW